MPTAKFAELRENIQLATKWNITDTSLLSAVILFSIRNNIPFEIKCKKGDAEDIELLKMLVIYTYETMQRDLPAEEDLVSKLRSELKKVDLELSLASVRL